MGKNIAITETYLTSTFRLDSQSRKATLNTIKELSSTERSNSLQIHNIDKIKCDTSFRSARVSQDLRIIFSMQGDTYTLLYVDHHDDAYNWCEGKYLARTNFGAGYLYDEKLMLQEKSPVLNQDYFIEEQESVLHKLMLKAKHLVKLGIPEIHAENLMKVASEDTFIDYIAIFPSEIQEALLDLFLGQKSFEDVYNELTDAEFNPTNQSLLEQKDSKRRFYITQSVEELQVLMENDDFEKWTIFLHPSQEKIVMKNFNGPALVEGGPGTGKTIVGIHRAVYLAEKVYCEEGSRVLFCTFSKKLANVVNLKIALLQKQRGSSKRIEVMSIDSLIARNLGKTESPVMNVDMNQFRVIFKQTLDDFNARRNQSFFEQEYFEVIEKYDIKILEEYLNVNREGMKIPLDQKQRQEIWRFFESLITKKKIQNIYTFVDRANLLCRKILSGEIEKYYDSVIIDEAQDLESPKLKAVVSLVRTQKNNVLILSDVNQRIFRLNSWKKDGNVNIVGRTQYLSVNYRTTKQINDYAQMQFMNTIMEKSYLKEYKSIVNGSEPEIIELRNTGEQLKEVVKKIKEITLEGYASHQICVVCSTRDECKMVVGALAVEDIKSNLLIDDKIPIPGEGVCICPINGVKGLEFEVVLIFNFSNISHDRIGSLDTSAIQLDYQKLVECEKYVAATRARDKLIITYSEEGDKS